MNEDGTFPQRRANPTADPPPTALNAAQPGRRLEVASLWPTSRYAQGRWQTRPHTTAEVARQSTGHFPRPRLDFLTSPPPPRSSLHPPRAAHLTCR